MNTCWSICSSIKCTFCCETCCTIIASIPAYICTAHHRFCSCGEPSTTKYEIVEENPPDTFEMSRDTPLKF